MGGGMGLRTIWITLRAVNYTERIFREVIRGVETLKGQQKKLNKEQLQSLRIGNAMIMTGMMMAVVGQMMLQNLWQMALATREGAIEMSQLTAEMEEAKIALADTIYGFLKVTGILDMFHGILAAISEDENLRKAIVLLIGVAGATMVLVGGIMLLAGAMKSYFIVAEYLPQLLSMMKIGWLTEMIAVENTALAYWQLALAAGAAFGVFFLLKDILGPIPAALIAISVGVGLLAVQLWLAAGAVSVLTGGLAAIAGAAALAGVISMVTGVTGKAMGTRGLPHTGLFVGHKGEVVYNPATHRPTQIGNEIEGIGINGKPSVTHQKVEIEIEHLHTEAPYDEIDEKMGKTLRRKMRNSR